MKFNQEHSNQIFGEIDCQIFVKFNMDKINMNFVQFLLQMQQIALTFRNLV